MTSYNDDDVKRGVASSPVGHRAMAEDGFSSYFCHSDEEATRRVLDAVLPAYRKRLLNELADEILDDWDGDIHSIYAADWLRVKAGETP